MARLGAGRGQVESWLNSFSPRVGRGPSALVGKRAAGFAGGSGLLRGAGWLPRPVRQAQGRRGAPRNDIFGDLAGDGKQVGWIGEACCFGCWSLRPSTGLRMAVGRGPSALVGKRAAGFAGGWPTLRRGSGRRLGVVPPRWSGRGAVGVRGRLHGRAIPRVVW